MGGLVNIGDSEILPAPLPTIFEILHGGAGGGQPGKGFKPPKKPKLRGVYLPNGDNNVAFWGISMVSDLPILTREFEGDLAMSSGQEDTISVDDENYVETTDTAWPTTVGHRVEYTNTVVNPYELVVTAQGYGYEDHGPVYQYIAALWDYVDEDYAAAQGHVAEEKALVTLERPDCGDWVSGSDIVSVLLQSRPWADGENATVHILTYYTDLEVYR